MLIVWILTGMWHGAAWNFLFWGLLNFAFLVLERLFEFEKREGKTAWRHLYCKDGRHTPVQTVSETGMGGVSGRDDDRICGSCALYIQERIQSFYLL